MPATKKSLWFWGIIALVLSMQFSGLDFGLPQQYHPDEYFVNLSTFKLFHELRGFHFEKTYYVLGVRWLYFAEFCGAAFAGRLLGYFPSFASFYQGYFASGNPYVDAAPPLFYLLPRITSFLFYAGCLWLLFAIAKKFTGGAKFSPFPKIVLAAALFLPAGFLYGHYGTRESAICFFTLLLIYHAYFYFDPRRFKSVITAGVLLGIAFGVKENGVLFYFLYLFFLLGAFKDKRLSLKRLILCALALAAVMIVVFLLLNPQRLMINNLQETTRRYLASSTPIAVAISNPHLIYPRAFMHEFSLPGLLLLLAGMTIAWRARRELRPLIGVILGTYLVLDFIKGNGFDRADRFIMNIFLPVLFVGAIGLQAGLEKIKKEKYLWLLPLVIVLCNAYELSSIFLALNGHDTRDTARKWIAANVPKNSAVARETIYTPLLDTLQYRVGVTAWVLGNYSLDSLKKLGIEYVFFSDKYSSGWVDNERINKNYRSFKPYVIKSFETNFHSRLNGFHSPAIWVCKIQ
ncbi:MAG: glycosyltransferase family 39 protein [Chitinivibrionales bacterium]|nr:glycosyltransferase family 39 protein [Chitinivibrionales bacterium]